MMEKRKEKKEFNRDIQLQEVLDHEAITYINTSSPPHMHHTITAEDALRTHFHSFNYQYSYMEVSFIIGIIGNIISILVFLSPVGTFRRVVRKKSTESFKALPYVCTLLCTSLWTFYGLLKPGGLLVFTVNGAGAILQATYVTLFLIYAPKETKMKYLKLVGALNIGCAGLVVVVTLLAIHGSIQLTIVGSLCAALTLGMYASPLFAMRTVIATKSVEYMPFSLSFFLFLNGCVWSIYAALVKDFFIGVPNAIGFVLGTAQLILYMVYQGKSGSKPTGKLEEEKEEEKGSAHLVRKDLEMGKVLDSDKPERILSTGSSMPKTVVSRQHSLKKISKTHSSSPYESHVEVEDAQTVADAKHP